MSDLTRNGAVFTDLLLEVFRVHRLLLDAGDAVVSPVGLTSAQWQVLGVVEHGAVGVTEVACTMGLTREDVQRTADGLAAEGLIVCADDPRDPDARLMTLTPAGARALEAVKRRHAEWATRVGWELSLSDMRVALRALRQIREVLEPAAAERG